METTPPSGSWFPCWAPREVSWKICNNHVVLLYDTTRPSPPTENNYVCNAIMINKFLIGWLMKSQSYIERLHLPGSRKVFSPKSIYNWLTTLFRNSVDKNSQIYFALYICILCAFDDDIYVICCWFMKRVTKTGFEIIDLMGQYMHLDNVNRWTLAIWIIQ